MDGYGNPPQAGPLDLGWIADLGAGTYTDIVSITAPAQAAPGETVNIQVKVKNLATFAIYISTSAKYDNTVVYLYPESASVGAGATYTFSGTFTMPNKPVRVYAWSYYWTGTEWYQDDSKYVDVTLAEVFAGTIARMEIEHDGTYDNIPAYNLPQNERGLVHITGRNDTSQAQQMGIDWTVKNPAGTTIEHYTTWEAWPYAGAGDEHEFVGGRFTLDKTGTWTIKVDLLMNPSIPQVVDSYSGTLCSVKVVVGPPEFSGFAISRYDKI